MNERSCSRRYTLIPFRSGRMICLINFISALKYWKQCKSCAEAIQAYEMALGSTAPGDHDFLTKANIVWSRFIDTHQIQEAKAFTLRLLRAVPPEAVPEVTELVDRTYAL